MLLRVTRSGRSSRGRRLAITVAGVALVFVIGARMASAFFTSGGSGTGSATTGTMQTVTVVAATGTPTTPLVPGATGDVVLKVNNPNHFAVSVAAVSYNSAGSITFDAAHSACTTTDASPIVSFSVPAGDLPLTVAASSSASFDLANSVTMAMKATSNCQGATIFIPVTITANSK
jgi:hypothetical protein